MGNVVSCQSWRDAKTVIERADSLLVKGVIMRDTAALACAIETLDKPITRKFARDELAKAYYLMGRNLDDYHHNFADAADYYIEADRLKTKDLVLRGRINSCMGYLCKQDSCFKEALVFYERANEAFAASGNERRYANGLLSIAEQYANIEDYAKADSVLSMAEVYEIDSAYYARLVDVKALALFNQQLYDSALIYLLSIKHYPRNKDAQCYSYMKIMQSFIQANEYELAAQYANYLLANTKNPTYRTNAYYCLLRYAEINSDMDGLAKYSHLRKDEDRKVQRDYVLYAEAFSKLKSHSVCPHPYRGLNIAVILGISFLVLGFNRFRQNRKRIKREEQKSEELQTQILNMESEREHILEQNIQIVKERVLNNSVEFSTTSDIWKDSVRLIKKGNDLYYNLFSHLQKEFGLKEQELKLILLVLLDTPNNTIADLLSYSPKSVAAIKRYVANKLGTKALYLKDFLIKYMASKSIIS